METKTSTTQLGLCIFWSTQREYFTSINFACKSTTMILHLSVYSFSAFVMVVVLFLLLLLLATSHGTHSFILQGPKASALPRFAARSGALFEPLIFIDGKQGVISDISCSYISYSYINKTSGIKPIHCTQMNHGSIMLCFQRKKNIHL